MIDEFLPKLEELVERSKGRVRADVARDVERLADREQADGEHRCRHEDPAPSRVLEDHALDDVGDVFAAIGGALERFVDFLPLHHEKRIAFLVEQLEDLKATRRDLLTNVWRMPYGGADKTVDVHLSWLRRKLGDPPLIETVVGKGYRM